MEVDVDQLEPIRSSFFETSDFNLSATELDNLNALELSALCCDEDLLGYDKNAGTCWIYPTNYPMRDYQFNIVQSALFRNTLVSLPTGLGKTFIAAVVMYNFYRWYPTGKIVFVAPTRPLVAQQIDACYNIMAIPQKDTIEMTGSTQTASRKQAWSEKRVFFATPQVVQNDLESGICPGELIRCLVIDEAHRAKGRHSYCQLIELLYLKGHKLFRVLALSATPGSKVEDVVNIIQNLKISHLELRTEESLDVSAYSHSRKIQTVIVKFGDELSNTMQRFIDILDVYTRRLVQYKILTGNISNLSKGRIIMLYKEYQNKEKTARHPQHKYIMLDFTMIITLYHAMELLSKHGSRVFLNFFDDHTDKKWVGKDDRLTRFLEQLRDDLGTDPLSIDRSTLPDGTIPEIKEDLKFGHPKFDHLREIMTEHFNQAKNGGQDTRAIVFCEYRESVNLVHCLLLQCRPLIKPQMFIGQGFGGKQNSNMKSFTQKQQLRVMQLFRNGTYNVLVSTSVGEEGLDVGNVDLIVCFDISNKSPIRLVQRCGRTGRERGGRVVILVTEGREHQTLRECMYQRDNLNKKILQSKEIKKCLYTASPRMVPSNITPQCQKMFITVKKVEENNDVNGKKVQTKIKDIFNKKPRASKTSNLESALIREEEYNSILGGKMIKSYVFPEPKNLWKMTEEQLNTLFKKDSDEIIDSGSNIYNKQLEWQRNLQYTSLVGHSVDSKDLCDLLQYADTLKFQTDELPQIDILPDINYEAMNSKMKTVPEKKNKIIQSNVKSKNIKDMFTKIDRKNNKEQWDFQDKYTELLAAHNVDVSSENSINNYLVKNKISRDLVDLIVQMEMEHEENVEKLKASMFEYNFEQYIPKPCEINKTSVLDFRIPDISILENITFSNIRAMEKNLNSKILSPTISKTDHESTVQNSSVLEKNNVDVHPPETTSKIDKSDIIDFDAILDSSDLSPDEVTSNKNDEINKSTTNNDETKNPLKFFGLNSLDDLFGEDSFDASADSVKNGTKTPPIIEKSDEESKSPILCSQRYPKNKGIILPKEKKSEIIKANEGIKSHNESVQGNNTTLLSITQIIDMINEAKSPSVERDNLDVAERKPNKTLDDMIDWDFLDDTDDSTASNRSAIICSQRPRNIVPKIPKTNVVIKESSNSSDEFDTQTNTNCYLVRQIDTNVLNKSPKPFMNKTLDSINECSPFFGKYSRSNSPTLLRPSRKIMPSQTLKAKLDSSLKCINSSPDNQKENVCGNNENSPTAVNKSANLNLSRFKKVNRRTFKNNLNNSAVDSSDDSDDFVLKTIDDSKHPERKVENKKIRKKIKPRCNFIEHEAALSDDSYVKTSGDSDSGDGSDTSLEGFICDKIDNLNDSVDMEAKYLQSVKSPVKSHGMFKIPTLIDRKMNILSQPVEQDASYELDSFCVENDSHLTQHHEMSELEIAEAILKKRKRRKGPIKGIKKKQTSKESTSDDSPLQVKPKRTCLRIDSQSSEDSESDIFT